MDPQGKVRLCSGFRFTWSALPPQPCHHVPLQAEKTGPNWTLRGPRRLASFSNLAGLDAPACENLVDCPRPVLEDIGDSEN